MHSHQRVRPAATLLFAGIMTVAGCSTTTESAAAAGVPTSATPTTAVTPTEAATPEPVITEAPVLVLEDAGLETLIAPGTYTSRLFAPTFTVELGDGWFRRDAGSERTQSIRRGEDGGDDLTFISGVDFIQCDDGELIELPDASTVVDAIFGSPKLHGTQPAEIKVGDLLGTEIVLPGTGKALPEDAWEHYLDFGCVISIGEEPYPGESGWAQLTREMAAQLVFVDVDGVVVMLRARADDSTTDVEALWDYMREVIGTVQFG